MLGKSIRIYLKDGNVTGIRFAELVNQTIQALACPRNKLSDLNEYFKKEINTQGVYFLIGLNEDTLVPSVYIGEGENVWERLKSHDLKKDFWNEVIIVTSKDENLTKSHVKYLESRIVEISKKAERYFLENGNNPTLSSLPLPDKDAMEEFLLNIKILLGTLGHKFLENSNLQNESSNGTGIKTTQNIIKQSNLDTLELKLNVKGITATAVQTNEGIVVLESSNVALNPTKNYGYRTLRERLISQGVIGKGEGENLVFTKNNLFKSPSAAAAVILGYSVNGRHVWKDKNGKSIKEIEKSKVN